MKNIITTIKNNMSIVKTIVYIALGITIVYLLIQIFTAKPQIPAELNNRLENLTKVTDSLQKKIKEHDLDIQNQEKAIDSVDNEISKTKEKTTIIKKYYYEKSNAVNNYTPNQLDSFFSNRY